MRVGVGAGRHIVVGAPSPARPRSAPPLRPIRSLPHSSAPLPPPLQPSDFWGCIFDSIRHGGDVDTIAAIAGSMAGAFNGLSGIRGGRPDADVPLKRVYDVRSPGGMWHIEGLLRLSDAMYTQVSGRPALAEMPAELRTQAAALKTMRATSRL